MLWAASQPTSAPGLVGQPGQPGHVEQLPAAVEHGGQQHQGDVRPQRGAHVVLVDGVTVAAGHHFQLRAAQGRPALHGVDIGGKVERGDQQVLALALGPVQRRQQRMQVGGDAAGGDHLARRSAHQPRQGGRERFGQPEPLVPTRHRLRLPLAQAAQHRLVGAQRHQAEAVAVEVDAARHGEQFAARPEGRRSRRHGSSPAGSSTARAGAPSASLSGSGRQIRV